MRLFSLFLVVLTLFIMGCGSAPTLPKIDFTESATMRSLDGHISWGQWQVYLDPESGIASAVPVRDADFHISVTHFLEPPNCEDCLQILISGYDPVERVADITMVLKNPTALSGYDVKAIISDYDLKEFIKPDAYADFYTDGTTWDPYYIFAEDEEDHEFGAGASHAVGFQVYVPAGSTANAMVTVDVSWPAPQREPWRIDNLVIAGPLQNDDYHHIAMTCHIRDHQDDVQIVLVDMTPIGPNGVPMGDDSYHKDYLAGDGIWGLDEIKTTTAPGTYEVWIRARSMDSEHFTYQKAEIEIILPVFNPPPLYIVSMMHAEEQDLYLEEVPYLGYANLLRDLMQVFDNHEGKIALQPDWTFIKGTMDFDPTLFADFQASGHGVDTHAHESQYDLGYVHNMLDAAGVTDTIVANGGFMQTVGDDGNWAAYISNFITGCGEQMFYVAVAYKHAPTQTVDSMYTPIRPSTTGDWMIHDPESPIVYIPGAPDTGLTGGNPNFFILLPQAVDYALAGVIPGKINCFYWHDPVILYSGSPLSETRLNFWGQLFNDYFDDKVDEGKVVWANFNEIYQVYLQWEEDNG